MKEKLLEIIEFERKFAEKNKPLLPHANIIVKGNSFPIFIPQITEVFIKRAIKEILKLTLKEDYDMIVVAYEGEMEIDGKITEVVTIVGMEKETNYRTCRIYKRSNGNLELYREYENEKFDEMKAELEFFE